MNPVKVKLFPRKLTALSLCVITLAANLKASAQGGETLKRRIGQMIIIGFKGTDVSKTPFAVKAIQELNIGGVILFDINQPSGSFPRNIVNADQLAKLTTELQKSSSIPLLIAIDAEGGWVNRLKQKYGFIDIPSHEELGKIGDPIHTRTVSRTLARQLAGLGINTNFAPVLDVKINPNNPIISKQERSFSDDPLLVYKHAKAFIEGQHEYRIITAVKHFPGHGSSAKDTHEGMVDATGLYQDKELIPYQLLITDRLVDMVMTSHIINKLFDKVYPATLSNYYIKKILRERYQYDGVVISDDMQMKAITSYYGFEDSLIRAVKAGCDMLIIANNAGIYDENAPYRAIDILHSAVQRKILSEERINEALRRIRSLKASLIVR